MFGIKKFLVSRYGKTALAFWAVWEILGVVRAVWYAPVLYKVGYETTARVLGR